MTRGGARARATQFQDYNISYRSISAISNSKEVTTLKKITKILQKKKEGGEPQASLKNTSEIDGKRGNETY